MVCISISFWFHFCLSHYILIVFYELLLYVEKVEEDTKAAIFNSKKVRFLSHFFLKQVCFLCFSIYRFVFFVSPSFIFVHASSTHEFGAMLSDFLVQFSILYPFSEPYELRLHSCILHQGVWIHASWLTREDPLVQSFILAFYSEPNELRFRSCILHPRVWSHA